MTSTFGQSPAEQWIKVPLPECVIIERPLWDAAQRRLEQNRIMTNSRRQFTALLSGFLYCADCGRRIYGARTRSKGVSHLERYWC